MAGSPNTPQPPPTRVISGLSPAHPKPSQDAQVKRKRTGRREQRRNQTLAVIAAAAGLTLILGVVVAVQNLTSPREITAIAANPYPSVPLTALASPSASATPSATAPAIGEPGTAARAMYGRPLSGLTWHSGLWPGGRVTTKRMVAAGTWRGRSMDFATVYPAYGTWEEIAHSTWAVTDLRGFDGRIAYGLPLLPKNRSGQWQDILNGSHDHVFRGIAQLLVSNGHADAAIRMGVEANGYWFPWSVTAATADEYQRAFIRVRSIMRAVSPQFTFWMDLNAGNLIKGSTDRMSTLTALYPGDAYVDGISMDHYDRNRLPAKSPQSFAKAMSPPWAAGLADAAVFARAHKKGFAVPEWGLDGVQGPGDNPYFVQKMFDFFSQNSDVLVFENYFSEPKPYIKGALFDSDDNPLAAAAYLQHWGKSKTD